MSALSFEGDELLRSRYNRLHEVTTVVGFCTSELRKTINSKVKTEKHLKPCLSKVLTPVGFHSTRSKG
ncbi:MAG: hypothetical protein WAJ93_08135, partial [Candidatus Nitrosopolaris sp.]